jgi:hypothetical protein
MRSTTASRYVTQYGLCNWAKLFKLTVSNDNITQHEHAHTWILDTRTCIDRGAKYTGVIYLHAIKTEIEWISKPSWLSGISLSKGIFQSSQNLIRSLIPLTKYEQHQLSGYDMVSFADQHFNHTGNGAWYRSGLIPQLLKKRTPIHRSWEQ